MRKIHRFSLEDNGGHHFWGQDRGESKTDTELSAGFSGLQVTTLYLRVHNIRFAVLYLSPLI